MEYQKIAGLVGLPGERGLDPRRRRRADGLSNPGIARYGALVSFTSLSWLAANQRQRLMRI